MNLDGYTNLVEFAEGGMARLYKARQISLNRTVVIKILSTELLWDSDAKQLFEQESLVIAQLNHANIIHIIDRGITQKNQPYFAMEYIHGHDLSVLLKQNKLNSREKIDILMQVCKGMACAHRNGIIHRDIKPANILIDNDGHARVLDFGIAWLAASGKSEEVVGTPDYMSPEQFNAPASVTFLSDIYSLGIMIYELFLSRLPTPYLDNLMDSMSTLPSALSTLINDCLQINPNDRPQSVDEIRLRLLSISQGAHITKKQKTAAQTVVNNEKNNFFLLDIIKQDQYGEVYLFEDKAKQHLFVIKKRLKSEAGFKEASMLSHIRHKNIIKILGTSKNKHAFIVVMEHLPGASLQDRLSRPYTISKFKDIALSLCNAMHHAHKHKITHGNLRPSNILFNEKNEVKITDFGFDEHYRTNSHDTDWYQVNDPGLSKFQRDIFSAGAIFYHMLTGQPIRFDHERIQTDRLFNSLDPTLKAFFRNTLEKKSKSHYKSFKHVSAGIKKLQLIYSLEDNKKIVPKKANPIIKPILLITLFISFISILFSAYFYFRPSSFENASILIKHWFIKLQNEAPVLFNTLSHYISSFFS